MNILFSQIDMFVIEIMSELGIHFHLRTYLRTHLLIHLISCKLFQYKLFLKFSRVF